VTAHQSRPRITFSVLAVACVAFAMLQSLVIPVLPTLQHALGTSQTDITWLITAYLIAASVATPILGRLGDVIGKEKVLVISLASLAAGSVIAALATNLGVMVLGRLVQGAGGAVFPLAFGIIRDELPREKVAGAIGAISSLLAAGGGLGVVLGGPIATHLGYHWLFWVPVPFVVIAAIAAHRFIPETLVRSPGLPHPAGAALLAGWLVALLLGVSRGAAWGWSSPRVLGLFAAAAMFFALWTVVESRVARPLIDLRLLRQPAVLRTNLVAFLVGIVVYSTFAVLPQFLQAPSGAGYGFAASVTASGFFLLPSTLMNFGAGQLVGRLTRRMGSRGVTVLGTSLTTVALIGLVLMHDRPWQVYAVMALFGCGVGLAFAAISNLVVEAAPPSHTGVAAGVNTNIRTIGGAIGGQTVAVLITANLTAAGLPREAGYVHAFLVLAVAAALATVAALCVPRRPTARRAPVLVELAQAA
jgi:MFS family permease